MKRNKFNKFYDNKVDSYKFKITNGSLYDKVIKKIPPGSKVLDVGCANGFFSKELLKYNCEVYGIEVSSKMANNAKKVLTKVIVGNIEEMKNPFKNEKFDAILCMDVLEHLFDPGAVLGHLKRKLTKSGVLIVTLPNIAHWNMRKELLLGRFNYQDSGILDNGHIRFFTYDTACQLFQENVFKVIHTDLVMQYPLLLLKIRNRWKMLDMEPLMKKFFPRLFAYQYIFVLSL